MLSSNLGNGVIAPFASGSHGLSVRSPVMGVLAPSSQVRWPLWEVGFDTCAQSGPYNAHTDSYVGSGPALR